MADLKKFDPKNPYGKVTKNTPAVVEKLNPKEGKLYEAMETSPDKIRKSKTYKLALWCPTMQEARRQAKEMNARTPFGRPKVSHDPNNPQSGSDYPLPQAEGPGAEVKQFIKQPKQDPKDALPDSPNKMPFKMTAGKKPMSILEEAEIAVQDSDHFQEEVWRLHEEQELTEDEAYEATLESPWYQQILQEAIADITKERQARAKTPRMVKTKGTQPVMPQQSPRGLEGKLLASMYDASQGLTWDITPKALVLRLDEAGQASLREAIEENGGSVSNQMEWELLESLFSNSELDTVRPEEVGALTDSILIGDVDRDDQGNITQVHNVYWDPSYAVRSFAQDLAEKGEASLPSGVEPATSSTDTKHFKVGDKVVSKIGEEGTVVEEEIGSKVGVEFLDMAGRPGPVELVRVKDLKLKGRLQFKAEAMDATLSFKKFENTQGKKDDAIELTIKPADEHVLALVTPGLDSMAGRFKNLGNGVYEVSATTVDEAKELAKTGLSGSGLEITGETDSVLSVSMPAPMVSANLRLLGGQVSNFAVGDTVIDRHGQSLEVAEIGNDKKRGPWLEVEYSDGDRNRYYDKPEGSTAEVKLDEDVKTLVKEDDYDPSETYPGDYPAGRSAEAEVDQQEPEAEAGPAGATTYPFKTADEMMKVLKTGFPSAKFEKKHNMVNSGEGPILGFYKNGVFDFSNVPPAWQKRILKVIKKAMGEAVEEDADPTAGLQSFDFEVLWKNVKAPNEEILRQIFSVDGEHAGAFYVYGEESDQEEHQNIGYRPFDVEIKKAGKGKFNVKVIFRDIRAEDMEAAEALSEDWGLHVNVDYLRDNGLDGEVKFPTEEGDTALADSSKLVKAKKVKASLGLRYFDPRSHRVVARLGAAPVMRQLHRAFGALKFKREIDFVEVSAGAQFLGTWHPKTQAFNFDLAADDTVKKLDSLFLRAMQVRADNAVNMVLEALSQVGAADVTHEDQGDAVLFSGKLANGVMFELALDDETLTLNPHVEFSDPEDMMGPPFEVAELQDADLPVQLEELMDTLKEMGGRVPEPVEARLKNLVAGLKIEGELLKVGDKVMVARSYGRGPVEEAVIASITLADEKGGAYGTEVKQMSWDLVAEGWATVTFEGDKGGWAYGYQLSPVQAGAEVQAASKWKTGTRKGDKSYDYRINVVDDDEFELIDNSDDSLVGTYETYEAAEDAAEGSVEPDPEYKVVMLQSSLRARALAVGAKVETMEGPGEIVEAGELQGFAKDPDVADQVKELAHHEPDVNIQGLDAEATVYKVKLEDGTFVLDDGTNLQAGRRPSRVFAKPKPKEAPAAESFKDKAKKALAKHLDIPLEEMPDPDGKGSHGFWDDELGEDRALSWGALTQEAGGRDYVVYRDYESAEEAAKRAVKNDLEDQPELFNQDWLMAAIPYNALKDHFEDVVRESVEFNVDDMDEDDLKEEMERAGVEDRDELIEKMIKEAGDPMDYVRDNFGDEEYGIQVKEVFRGLSGAELDEIAQEAVDADGPGHFISGWDGELTELDGDLYLAKW